MVPIAGQDIGASCQADDCSTRLIDRIEQRIAGDVPGVPRNEINMLQMKDAKIAPTADVEPQNETMPLAAEGSRFELLSVELKLLGNLCSHLRKNGIWTAQLEDQWDCYRERLLDEMHTIATAAIEWRAATPSQLRIKARIFLDYCAPEGGDVPDQLSISICQDILASGGRPPQRLEL
jgi:hypothetical protein